MNPRTVIFTLNVSLHAHCSCLSIVAVVVWRFELITIIFLLTGFVLCLTFFLFFFS